MTEPVYLDKLKRLETQFLEAMPGGFNHPDMLNVAKKHKMPQMIELAQSVLSEAALFTVNQAIEDWIKVVSRSSMVSLFEKPKFRDFVRALSADEKGLLVDGLREQLYGNEQLGFETIVNVLATGKLAKWSLVSIAPAYVKPTEAVFVKPTTAKAITQYFDLDVGYKPLPTWTFYTQYRTFVNEAKWHVDDSFRSSNAAFCGMLMMSLNP